MSIQKNPLTARQQELQDLKDKRMELKGKLIKLRCQNEQVQTTGQIVAEIARLDLEITRIS